MVQDVKEKDKNNEMGITYQHLLVPGVLKIIKTKNINCRRITNQVDQYNHDLGYNKRENVL